MKKTILSIATLVLFAFLATYSQQADAYAIAPKAPKISASLKPIIIKYQSKNYVGAMQDLEELVKIERNNTYAKYYLALCYTRLGYKEEAKTLYQEVVNVDENLALSHYSQRALNCLDNPNGELCNPKPPETLTKEEQEVQAEKDDITLFIESGKKIHPAAMDKITTERMERKLQEDEYRRKQLEQEKLNPNPNSKAYAPTNEEIASALNTLSKIGLNPLQGNPLAQAQQFNQFGIGGMDMFLNPTNNQNMLNAMLYSQMAQQNYLMDYGI